MEPTCRERGARGSHRSAPRLPAEVQVLRPACHQQSLATCVSPGSSVTRLRHAAVQGSLGSRRRLSPPRRPCSGFAAAVRRLHCALAPPDLVTSRHWSPTCRSRDDEETPCVPARPSRPRGGTAGTRVGASALLGLTHSAHTRVCVWRSVPVRRTRQDTDQGPSRRLLTPQLSPRDGESVFHPADSSFPECSVSGVLHSSGPRPLWHL